MSFYRVLANNFPNLKKDLASAGFTDTPEKYVRDTFQMSMLLSFGITVMSVFFFLKFDSLRFLILIQGYYGHNPLSQAGKYFIVPRIHIYTKIDSIFQINDGKLRIC